MIFFKILNYILGFLTVKIYGKFPERLLNIFSANKVQLWHLKRANKDEYTAKMRARDFKKSRKLVKNSKSKIKIIKKHGAPFILKKYKHRYGLIIGVLIFISLITIMNTFIWSIEITGNDLVTDNQIITSLQSLEITTITPKRKIELEKVEEKIVKDNNLIVWINAEIKGNKLLINVKEGKKPPEIIEDTYPSNIISNEDGIIVRMETYSGHAVKKVGDPVYKGQLLVSGILDGLESSMLTNSRAKIIANVAKSFTVEVPFEFTEKVKAAGEIKRYSLQFFDFSVKLYWLDKQKYQNYQVDSYTTELKLFSKINTPFKIREDNYYKLEEQTVNLSLEQAKIVAEEQYTEKERILISGEKIVDNNKEIVELEDRIVIRGNYILEKEIGMTVKITE